MILSVVSLVVHSIRYGVVPPVMLAVIFPVAVQAFTVVAKFIFKLSGPVSINTSLIFSMPFLSVTFTT